MTDRDQYPDSPAAAGDDSPPDVEQAPDAPNEANGGGDLAERNRGEVRNQNDDAQ